MDNPVDYTKMSVDHLELLIVFGKKENHVKVSKDFQMRNDLFRIDLLIMLIIVSLKCHNHQCF